MEALQLHWLTSIWIYDYWNQLCCDTITLLPVDLFGWARHDWNLSVEWDSPQNTLAVRERVAFLTHGCGCKTGCSKHITCVNRGESTQGNVLIDKISYYAHNNYRYSVIE